MSFLVIPKAVMPNTLVPKATLLRLALLLLFVLIILLSPRVHADETEYAPLAPASAVTAEHPVDDKDLASFIDEFVPRQLKEAQVAGATVIVVQDGKTLYARGFGMADVASRRPVDVEQTLFRVGSVSKLFTSVAVMQLVEAGKLDLDRDINDYLDFKIDSAAGAVPVTLRLLLTHRAGFEEQLKGQFVRQGQKLEALASYLPKVLPPRLYTQGDTPAYSNYGLTLAGYIVERVSGMPFESYVAQHILQPLAMTHSSFVQPLPTALAATMSSGYRNANGPAQSFEVIQHSPAAALSASGADMGRFMRMLLAAGTLDGSSILQPATLDKMWQAQTQAPPGMNCMTLGFMERSVDGNRLLGHGGETTLFRSDLLLLPRENFGVFVAYNSPGTDMENELGEALVQRYFARPIARPPTLTNAVNDALKVAGTYRFSRRSESSFLKLPGLFEQHQISAFPDGTIALEGSTDTNGNLQHWEEIAPLLFRVRDGVRLIAFNPSADGKTYTMRYRRPDFVLLPVPAYENRHFVMPLILGAFGVVCLSLLAWPLSLLRRKTAVQGDSLRSGSMRALSLLMLIVAGAGGALQFIGSSDPSLFDDGMDKYLIGIYALAWLSVVGSIGAIALTIRCWSKAQESLWARLHQSVWALSLLAISWAFIVWHVAGTTLRY